MQQRFFLSLFFFVVALMLPLRSVQAAFFNPDPNVFYDDSGAEMFKPVSLNVFLGMEALDIGSLLFSQSVFGFYFVDTDPTIAANRIALWGPDTHNTFSNPQAAIVLLDYGVVLDTGLNVTSTFSAASNVIGFYYELPAVAGGVTLFSQAALNPNGIDAFGFFPLISDPTAYLLEILVPFDDGSILPLGIEFLANLAPVTGTGNVPEPGILPLLILALLTYGAVTRNSARISA
ncbi:MULTISPECIES: hypothetical protein [Methylomonas]|uniref:hypothetical protein n=1 Tax=Methylomonas TaxID=416 RepID=UPI00123290D7|nr:hypothetical protein [Methylomonas rhizoryzae]